MSIDRLLVRPGLEPGTRLLVIGLVAIWRADWPLLCRAAASGRSRGVPRADFEEMLLQAVLFCGFPRTVTAFEEFTQVWPADATIAAGPARAEAAGELPDETLAKSAAQRVAERAAAGAALFDTIYGRNAAAVRNMLLGFHRDFHSFVLEIAYGRILARPGLSGRVRELLAIGALVASDQKRQFAGHARGAMHLGAVREELREVLVTVLGETAEVDTWLQRMPAPDSPATE